MSGKKTWKDQMEEGRSKWEESANPFTYPLADTLSEIGNVWTMKGEEEVRFFVPEIEEAARAWFPHAISRTVSEHADSAHAALRTCESPIEQVFLMSMVEVMSAHTECICVSYPEGSTLPRRLWWLPFEEWGPTRGQIDIQHPVGKYRTDFLVTLLDVGGIGEDRQPIWIRTSVFVECDGHDFHERTKEQAKRDRSKDRELQKTHKVLRFTGSEIWGDAFKCAAEVHDALVAEQSEKWAAAQRG